MFNKPLFSSSAPISTCSNLTSFLFSKHVLIASVNFSPNAFRYSDCAVRPCCVHGVLLSRNKACCIVLSTDGLAKAAAAFFGAFDSIRAAMAARTRALIESLVPCGHSISLISINSKAAGSSA